MATEIAFARKVKEELANNSYTIDEKKYILSGFARNGGTFSIGKEPVLVLHTEIGSVAKLLYSCLKEVYKLNPEIDYQKVNRFGKRLVYVVHAQDKSLYHVMEDLEILKDGFERIPPKEGLYIKNLKYLCIGCFLANGSVNNPSSSKTSYFLEMAFTDQNDAQVIRRKLVSFKKERTMSFKSIKRREKYVLYLKKSDQIAVFLSYIGAMETMLNYENARITKDDINLENRTTNCDMANYKKTIQTAQKDIDDIQYILKTTPITLFDEKTQAVMKIRQQFPEYNYNELARYLSEELNIPITKSGISHILTSIREKAKEQRNLDK